MIISLLILKLIIPVYSTVRIINLFIIIIYTVIGSLVYLLYLYKTNSIKEIYGYKFQKKFKK